MSYQQKFELEMERIRIANSVFIEVSHLRQRTGYAKALADLDALWPDLEQYLKPFDDANSELYKVKKQEHEKSKESHEQQYKDLMAEHESKIAEADAEYELAVMEESRQQNKYDQALIDLNKLSFWKAIFAEAPDKSALTEATAKVQRIKDKKETLLSTKSRYYGEYHSQAEFLAQFAFVFPEPELYFLQFQMAKLDLERKLAIAQAAESPYQVRDHILNDLIDWETGVKRDRIEKVIDLAKLTPVTAESEIVYGYGRALSHRVKINQNFVNCT